MGSKKSFWPFWTRTVGLGPPWWCNSRKQATVCRALRLNTHTHKIKCACSRLHTTVPALRNRRTRFLIHCSDCPLPLSFLLQRHHRWGKEYSKGSVWLQIVAECCNRFYRPYVGEELCENLFNSDSALKLKLISWYPLITLYKVIVLSNCFTECPVKDW